MIVYLVVHDTLHKQIKTSHESQGAIRLLSSSPQVLNT